MNILWPLFLTAPAIIVCVLAQYHPNVLADAWAPLLMVTSILALIAWVAYLLTHLQWT